MHMHDDTTTRRLERPSKKPAPDPATVTGESNGAPSHDPSKRLQENALDLIQYLDRGDPFVDKRLKEMEEDLHTLRGEA